MEFVLSYDCEREKERDDRSWQTTTVNRSEWVDSDTTGAWETPVAIRIPVTRACRMHDAGAHSSSMYRMFHAPFPLYLHEFPGLFSKFSNKTFFFFFSCNKRKNISHFFFSYDQSKAEKLVYLSGIKKRKFNKYFKQTL